MMSKKLPVSGVLTANGVQELNTDGYVSMMTNVSGAQGAAGMSSPTARRMMSRMAAGMIPLNATLLNEQSGIGHRVVTEPVRAAMLAGYSIVTDKPEDAERIKKLFKKMNVWGVVTSAAIFRRAAGWSIIVLGGNFVRPHPAYRITPSNNWFSDYSSELFGLPEGWQIQLKSPIGGEVFIPQEDSILLGDKNNDPLYQINGTEFGTPVLGRAYSALERLGLSHELILSVLSISIQDIYKRNGLDDEMETQAGEAKAARRIGGIAATRQLNDIIAIDESEEITRLESSMTATADIIDAAIRIVSAETGVPVSILANTQAGLSNNDNSGDDVWMRLVESEQGGFIIPSLEKIAYHFTGIEAEFVPNKSQGDIKRDADVDYTRAQTVQIYYNMRSITSAEARETGKSYASFEVLTKNLPSDNSNGLKEDDALDEKDNTEV